MRLLGALYDANPILGIIMLTVAAMLLLHWVASWVKDAWNGWREKRRMATPEGMADQIRPMIEEARDDLQLGLNRLENARADFRRDSADMEREAEERQEAFIEKHKIRIVDDEDFERLAHEMHGGRELSPEELARHLGLERSGDDA